MDAVIRLEVRNPKGDCYKPMNWAGLATVPKAHSRGYVTQDFG